MTRVVTIAGADAVPVVAAGETASTAPLSRSRSAVPFAVVGGVYILLAMVANLPAWLHGIGHNVQVGGLGDLSEEAWFLGVTPYSLLELHNPFFTTWINFPNGANLMVNTTMFLPGLLMAPITFLAGAVASFNVLMVLGYAGSAFSAFAAFSRWVHWKPAAFFGGLLYGYSPYMWTSGYGHLFLLLVALPPIFLIVLDEILVRQRGRPLRWGLVLGVLTFFQLLISTEVLAGIFIMTAAGTSLLILFRWRHIADRLRYVVTAMFAALISFAVLSAYPLWMLLRGPQHITGPAQPVSVLAPLSTDLLGLIVPTANQAIAPASFQHVSNQFVNASLGENSSYLGLSLVLTLIIIVVLNRRLGIIRFASGMLAIGLIISFGSRLRIDGHNTGIHLPFLVLTHLPLFDSSVAVRYSLYVFLFAGFILAIGLDRMRLASTHSGARKRYSATIACAAIALVAVTPLVPRWPYPIWDTYVPKFFAGPEVRTIPRGTVMLPYPFPRGPEHNEAMLWQALNGFRYRMPGGYLITTGPGRTATFSGTPSTTESLLEDAYLGKPLPPLTRTVLCDVTNDLRIWRVQTIVVVPRGVHPAAATILFESVLHVDAHLVDGVRVLDQVQKSIRSAQPIDQCPAASSLP